MRKVVTTVLLAVLSFSSIAGLAGCSYHENRYQERRRHWDDRYYGYHGDHYHYYHDRDWR